MICPSARRGDRAAGPAIRQSTTRSRPKRGIRISSFLKFIGADRQRMGNPSSLSTDQILFEGRLEFAFWRSNMTLIERTLSYQDYNGRTLVANTKSRGAGVSTASSSLFLAGLGSEAVFGRNAWSIEMVVGFGEGPVQ